MRFLKERFPHLAGLHKLIDYSLMVNFANHMVSANCINSKIKQEKYTEQRVLSSLHFREIRDRYYYLTSETIKSLAFEEAVIGFDRIKADSSLRSRYIFFKDVPEGTFFLGVASKIKTSCYYPKTFFFDNSGLYARNQKAVKVTKLTILDENGNIVESI